jgi:hypothetical protein
MERSLFEQETEDRLKEIVEEGFKSTKDIIHFFHDIALGINLANWDIWRRLGINFGENMGMDRNMLESQLPESSQFENEQEFEDFKQRALISFTERQIEATREDWVHDIPFILVPSDVIGSFREYRFTFEEFYNSKEWSLPSHWNAALVRDGKIVVFVYGRYSLLEKELFVGRLGSAPSFQGKGNRIIQLVLNEVENIARKKGLEYIWMMTDRRGLYRKGGGRGVKRTDKFILENDKF